MNLSIIYIRLQSVSDIMGMYLTTVKQTKNKFQNPKKNFNFSGNLQFFRATENKSKVYQNHRISYVNVNCFLHDKYPYKNSSTFFQTEL